MWNLCLQHSESPGYYRKRESTLFSCNEFYRSIIYTSPNLTKQPIHSPETHHFPNTEILKFPSTKLQFFLKGFGRALEKIAAIQEQKNDNLKFTLGGQTRVEPQEILLP